jgi:hypothetical protein
MALPPTAGTDQMSPLYSKSRVRPSGEIAGYRSHKGASSAAVKARHTERTKAKDRVSFIAS